VRYLELRWTPHVWTCDLSHFSSFGVCGTIRLLLSDSPAPKSPAAMDVAMPQYAATPSPDVEEHMSVSRYITTRISSLVPPMNPAPNPFKALTLLNRTQWLNFTVCRSPNRAGGQEGLG
jgi:hypothetical protein